MKKNLIYSIGAIATLSVVLVAVLYLMQASSAPPTLSAEGPRWPRNEIIAANGMVIYNPLGKFRFQLRGDTWWMTSPVEDHARVNLIDRLLTHLGGLRFGVSMKYDSSKSDEWKISRAKAVRVELLKNGKPFLVIHLGKSRKYTLLWVPGSDRVWQLKGPQRQMFVKNTLAWLDPRALVYQDHSVRKITFEDKETGLKTSFKVDGKLHVTSEGDLSAIPDFYPGSVVRSIVRLSRMRAERILDTKDIGRVIHVITVKDDRGYTHTIEFGKVQGTSIAFRSTDRRWYGLVRRIDFDLIAKRHPEDFLSPVVLSFPKDRLLELQEIHGECSNFTYTFRHDGQSLEDWTVLDPKQGLIPSKTKLKEYMTLLERGYLRAEFIRRDDGTAPAPVDRMIYKFKDGSKVEVTFGPLVSHVYKENYLRPVKVSTRPGIIYYVTVRRTDKICRTKDKWEPPKLNDD